MTDKEFDPYDDTQIEKWKKLISELEDLEEYIDVQEGEAERYKKNSLGNKVESMIRDIRKYFDLDIGEEF